MDYIFIQYIFLSIFITPLLIFELISIFLFFLMKFLVFLVGELYNLYKNIFNNYSL